MLAENLMDRQYYSKSEVEYPIKSLTYNPKKEENEGGASGTETRTLIMFYVALCDAILTKILVNCRNIVGCR